MFAHLAMKEVEMQVPSFMKLTGDALWEHMKEAFDDDAAFIRSVRLEEFEEALNRSEPKEFDPEIGMEIKHPRLVPYRRTNDDEELVEKFEYAREVIPELAQMFAVRELSPEFFHLWGNFRHACGFVDACYFSRGDDLGQERRAASTRLRTNRHYRWLSHQLLPLIQNGQRRPEAEQAIAEAIRELILSKQYPARFDRRWFQVYVAWDPTDNEEKRYAENKTVPEIENWTKVKLASTFTAKHLSRRRLEELASDPMISRLSTYWPNN
jgi:hypothetical protein